MKKLLLAFIFTPALCAALLAQSPSPTPFDYKDGVVQKYDRFDDSTTTSLKLNIKGSLMPLRGLTLIIVSHFSGEKPTSKDNPVLITMVGVSSDSDYKNLHSLIFLVDGERIRLGEGTYSSEFVDVDVLNEHSIMEKVSYPISQSALKKIINAKTLEAQFGGTQFTFRPHQVIYLQVFDIKITPQ